MASATAPPAQAQGNAGRDRAPPARRDRRAPRPAAAAEQRRQRAAEPSRPPGAARSRAGRSPRLRLFLLLDPDRRSARRRRDRAQHRRRADLHARLPRRGLVRSTAGGGRGNRAPTTHGSRGTHEYTPADGRAHVHRRAGGGELLHRPPRRLRPGGDRRSRRGGRPDLGAVDELGVTVEAVLVTHCHFDHVGAVAPVARATGAPVYVSEIERPVLADIMSYVPFAGLRPVRELRGRPHAARRRAAQLAGTRDRRALHARPQPRAPDLLRSPRSRRSSPATSCSRDRSGASTCLAATGGRCWPRSAAWSSRCPRRRPSTPATWASRRSAPSAARTRSWPSSPAELAASLGRTTR